MSTRTESFNGDLFERLRGRLREEHVTPVCIVCRKAFLPPTGRHKAQVTCSPHCSMVYAKCRNYFNPEAHEQHVRRSARNVLAHPEKHSPKTVQRAQDTLDGKAPKRVVRANTEVYVLLKSVRRLDLLPTTESPSVKKTRSVR